MNGNLSVFHQRAGTLTRKNSRKHSCLPTEQNSLKPAREKCGGVRGRQRAILRWWLAAFRITGRSRHLWAPRSVLPTQSHAIDRMVSSWLDEAPEEALWGRLSHCWEVTSKLSLTFCHTKCVSVKPTWLLLG